MAPVPVSKLTRDLREVPGNNGLQIGANQDTTCFSIYDLGITPTAVIHVCDWPAFVGAVARLMEDRANDGLDPLDGRP
jgi:hypothetical protein